MSDVIGSFSVLVLLSRPVTLIAMLMFSTLQTPCTRVDVSRIWFPPRSTAFNANTQPVEERVSLVSPPSVLSFVKSLRPNTGDCTFRHGSLGCNLGSRRLNPRSNVNEAGAFLWTVYEMDQAAFSKWHRSFVFFTAVPPEKRVTKAANFCCSHQCFRCLNSSKNLSTLFTSQSESVNRPLMCQWLKLLKSLPRWRSPSHQHTSE